MIQNWLVLIIISGLASNGFNTVLRHTLKNNQDSTAYAWWFEVLRTTFFLLLLPWDHQYIHSPSNLFWLLTLGISEVIAVYTYMRMHASTELSISSIITRMRSIWIAILAFIFIGERLTMWQYIGVLIIVLGTLVVRESGKIKIDKSLKTTLIFTFASAISTIIMKHTTSYASTAIINLAFSLPSIILLPMLMRNPAPRIKISFTTTIKSNVTASIFNILTMLTMVAALKLANASQVVGVFQGITMLTVVMGIFILNERDHKVRKLFAAAITTVGILLLV